MRRRISFFITRPPGMHATHKCSVFYQSQPHATDHRNEMMLEISLRDESSVSRKAQESKTALCASTSPPLPSLPSSLSCPLPFCQPWLCWTACTVSKPKPYLFHVSLRNRRYQTCTYITYTNTARLSLGNKGLTFLQVLTLNFLHQSSALSAQLNINI